MQSQHGSLWISNGLPRSQDRIRTCLLLSHLVSHITANDLCTFTKFICVYQFRHLTIWARYPIFHLTRADMSIHGLWSKGESNLDLFSLLVMATSNSYINLPWPSCFQHPDYLSGPCSLASVTSYVWGIFGIRTHAVRRLATAHPYVLLIPFL